MEELQGRKVELHCGWKFCKLNIVKLKLRLTLILKDNFTSWTGDKFEDKSISDISSASASGVERSTFTTGTGLGTGSIGSRLGAGSSTGSRLGTGSATGLGSSSETSSEFKLLINSLTYLLLNLSNIPNKIAGIGKAPGTQVVEVFTGWFLILIGTCCTFIFLLVCNTTIERPQRLQSALPV